MYSFLLLSLFSSAIYLVPHAQSLRMCPMRKCDTCLDRKLLASPGIGVHLGLTSATVAVSNVDGNVENIISVPGSPEYISLMQDFSTKPDRLGPPPMDTFPQRMSFVQKELKRRINLLFGRPGSSTAATLSSALRLIRSITNSHLSASIDTISVAVPAAIIVSLKEINDALVHAGFKKLDDWQLLNGELNAAYGAYGFGLCPSYTDPYQCEAEEDAFGEGDWVLHIDYTNRTLSADANSIYTARSPYSMLKFLDWELGRDNASRWVTNTEYWSAVKSRIQDLAPSNGHPYTKLLVTGEAANDETFLKVLKEALWDAKLRDQIDIVMDPRFLVARGAAEMQRRRQRGWLECVQTQVCRETTIWENLKAKYNDFFDIWR